MCVCVTCRVPNYVNMTYTKIKAANATSLGFRNFGNGRSAKGRLREGAGDYHPVLYTCTYTTLTGILVLMARRVAMSIG